MGDTASEPGEWLRTLRRMGDSLLAMAQIRLQLFALECQGEKLRLLSALLWLGVGLLIGGLGLMVGTAALALFIWEIAHYYGLILMACAYLIIALGIFWLLRNRLLKEPMPFADTIAEFKKDRACFSKKD